MISMRNVRRTIARIRVFHRTVKPNLVKLQNGFGVFRAQIVLSILLSLALSWPAQLQEIYSAQVQDLVGTSQRTTLTLLDPFVLVLAVISLCLVLWYTAISQLRLTESMKTVNYQGQAVLFMAPAFFSILPLLAIAYAYNAIAATEKSRFPEHLAVEKLTATLNGFAIAYVIIAIILLAILTWLSRKGTPSGKTKLTTYYPWPLLCAFFVGLVAIILLGFSGYFQVRVAQFIGPTSIIIMFSMALTLISSICVYHYDRHGYPLITALAALAIILSLSDTNENHEIRVLPRKTNDTGQAAQRTVKKAFDEWFANRSNKYNYPEGYPVYIIAAEGGGLYAAYHAALFLSRLQDTCPNFSEHVFAISGVSGGSLGAAVFSSSVSHLYAPDKLDAPDKAVTCHDQVAKSGRFQVLAAKALADDFLSPLVFKFLFPDFFQHFFPIAIPPFDRARGLERSFELAWSRATATSDLENLFATAYSKHWSPSSSAPALVLNTTRVDLGGRQLIAPFRPISGSLHSSYAELGTTMDLPLSTAIGLSARFPLVTPAGWMPLTHETDIKGLKVQLVDGGVFENSGLDTALDIFREIEGRRNNQTVSKPYKLRIITIRSRQARLEGKSLVAELVAPVKALYNSRIERASLSYYAALRELCLNCKFDKIDKDRRLLPHYLDLDQAPIALGWYLSSTSMSTIHQAIGGSSNCPKAVDSTLDLNNCTVEAIRQQLLR